MLEEVYITPRLFCELSENERKTLEHFRFENQRRKKGEKTCLNQWIKLEKILEVDE